MNNKHEILHSTNEDWEAFLLERKKLMFKFSQLKPDMYFIEQHGYDDFLHIITAVNFKNKTFQYIDLSLPEDKRLEETANNLYIPAEIYENEQFLNDKILFKFVEIDENQIMQLYNTTDFEKMLFHKHHVLSLRKIIEILKKQVNILSHELDAKIYENLDSKKVLNLKEYIKNLHAKFEINEPIVFDKPEKSDNISLENKVKNQNNIITILNEKLKKYKELYFESTKK